MAVGGIEADSWMSPASSQIEKTNYHNVSNHSPQDGGYWENSDSGHELVRPASRPVQLVASYKRKVLPVIV